MNELEEKIADVIDLKRQIKDAELSQLAGVKEMAFEMIKYNHDAGEVTIAEYQTQWFVTVKVAIPKNKK